MNESITSNTPLLSVFPQSVAHSVIALNDDWTIHTLSRSAEREFYYTSEELTGRKITHLFPSTQECDLPWCAVEAFHTPHDLPFIEINIDTIGRRKNGVTFPVHLYVTKLPVHGAWSYVAICYGLSEKSRHTEHFAKSSSLGKLTGCLNRQHTIKALDDAIINCAHPHKPAAAFLINLGSCVQATYHYRNNIKEKLLLQVANRLRSALKPADILGHLGGDQFLVVNIPNSGRALSRLSEKLLRTFDQPFYINSASVKVWATIGISLYPLHGGASDELISAAETALSTLRPEDCSAVRFFNEKMREEAERAIRLMSHIKEAHSSNQFELHYQLQFNLKTRTPSGLEALIRWRDPKGHLLQPDEFLSLAKEHGLMFEISNWVLRQACRDNAYLMELGILDVPVSVNISAELFCDPRLERIIIDACKENRLPLSKLEIELTEDSAMHDSSMAARQSAALKEQGILLVMDDFGTGHSSLSRLCNFQFQKLKIDRSFTKNLSESLSEQEILRSILSIARALNVQVVAEGIETTEQHTWLCGAGCDHGQGFGLARPMPLPELIQWIARHTDENHVSATQD
ncbi:EAL domain-containing protein [Pseudomonas putida]|uniref:sensor domain-containing protein n=1 Tax=Pseudomonas putida TaxID=303 RepID=UPI0018A97AAD|nr:EAL domain-containing protein [Pseudomonas putida]MBF8670258.1 EAL domain-containing protein [Pseudomonas putida]MBF8713132.1 EAL domain-containing protein [Pseudomonas putida]